MNYILTHFLNMYQLTLVTGIIAFLIPIITYCLFYDKKKWIRITLLVIYVLIVFWLTVFNKNLHSERMINLKPFWSYSIGNHVDVLLQVFMNVFLFIPFGFLIPFSSKRSFIQTLTIGLCLSVTIEALQYIFALGLCETDDVFHNTLGCIIGYWYWAVLNKLRKKRI